MEENTCAICNTVCVGSICKNCYRLGYFYGEFKCDYCKTWDCEGFSFKGERLIIKVDYCIDCIVNRADFKFLCLKLVGPNKPDKL